MNLDDVILAYLHIMCEWARSDCDLFSFLFSIRKLTKNEFSFNHDSILKLSLLLEEHFLKFALHII